MGHGRPWGWETRGGPFRAARRRRCGARRRRARERPDRGGPRSHTDRAGARRRADPRRAAPPQHISSLSLQKANNSEETVGLTTQSIEEDPEGGGPSQQPEEPSALVALLTSQELWGAVIIFLLVAFVIIKMAVRDYKGIRGECDPGVISKHDHCIHNASSFSEHMQREGIREEATSEKSRLERWKSGRRLLQYLS